MHVLGLCIFNHNKTALFIYPKSINHVAFVHMMYKIICLSQCHAYHIQTVPFGKIAKIRIV